MAKKKLISTDVVAHYDLALELKLVADASAYGVGAVLSCLIRKANFICLAHTLSSAEQNYTQVKKEALALVFGIKTGGWGVQGLLQQLDFITFLDSITIKKLLKCDP